MFVAAHAICHHRAEGVITRLHVQLLCCFVILYGRLYTNIPSTGINTSGPAIDTLYYGMFAHFHCEKSLQTNHLISYGGNVLIARVSSRKKCLGGK